MVTCRRYNDASTLVNDSWCKIGAILENGKPGDWFWMIALRASGVCEYCDLDGSKDLRVLSCMRMEHIIPRNPASKGPETFENMALGCAGCNAIKGKSNPATGSDVPQTREQLIKKVREYLETRRAYYANWVNSFNSQPRK
jgi:hypothetical protein